MLYTKEVEALDMIKDRLKRYHPQDQKLKTSCEHVQTAINLLGGKQEPKGILGNMFDQPVEQKSLEEASGPTSSPEPVNPVPPAFTPSEKQMNRESAETAAIAAANPVPSSEPPKGARKGK